MARSNVTDYLQDYPFWLVDVSPMEATALPLFTPLSGFSGVTAPELTIEQEEIVQANWYFKKHVTKRAEVNSITLTRGVTAANADFWNWASSALTGRTTGGTISLGGVTPKRNLVLVHFFSHFPVGVDTDNPAGLTAASLAALTSAGIAGLASAGLATGLTAAGLTADAVLGGGAYNFATRLPARAFVLVGCLPTRYKTGSDFDATSSAISISELDLSYEYFEQVSLA